MHPNELYELEPVLAAEIMKTAAKMIAYVAFEELLARFRELPVGNKTLFKGRGRRTTR